MRFLVYLLLGTSRQIGSDHSLQVQALQTLEVQVRARSEIPMTKASFRRPIELQVSTTTPNSSINPEIDQPLFMIGTWTCTRRSQISSAPILSESNSSKRRRMPQLTLRCSKRQKKRIPMTLHTSFQPHLTIRCAISSRLNCT